MEIRGEGQNKYWSSRATTYGNQYGLDTLTTKLKIRRKVEVMSQYLDFNKDKVVEFGCGTGLFTKEFSRLNKNLLSTDLSLEMIEVAKKYCPEVKFMQVDARKMQFDNESFDVVVSSFLLQHVETKLVLPEMSRILKHGGQFGAVIPNVLNPLHYGRSRVGWLRKILHENSEAENFTRWEWSRKLRGYGLEPICIRPIEFTSPYVPTSLVNISMGISNVIEMIPIIREFAGTVIIVARKV